jgi:hypothetical protein
LSNEQYQEKFAWYYRLVHQAGEQLIRQGQIASEVQAGLRQDLFPGGPEVFREQANRHWVNAMAHFGITAKPPEPLNKK